MIVLYVVVKSGKSRRLPFRPVSVCETDRGTVSFENYRVRALLGGRISAGPGNPHRPHPLRDPDGKRLFPDPVRDESGPGQEVPEQTAEGNRGQGTEAGFPVKARRLRKDAPQDLPACFRKNARMRGSKLSTQNGPS